MDNAGCHPLGTVSLHGQCWLPSCKYDFSSWTHPCMGTKQLSWDMYESDLRCVVVLISYLQQFVHACSNTVPYNFSTPKHLVNLIHKYHSYGLCQVWNFFIYAWVGYGHLKHGDADFLVTTNATYNRSC